jgi:lipoprotein-anchoring transpeptidase ErfK/SrfK
MELTRTKKTAGWMAAPLAAAILVTGALMPAPANAELVYNAMERRWEEIDPIARKISRPVPAKFKKRTVMVRTNEEPGTVIIDTHNKFLYYVKSSNQAIRYGVGVGKEGFEWNGVVKVQRKQEWPTWTPPAEMRRREAAQGRILPISMAGGPENPLGARAMYLYQGGRDTMYRIHGTNQPWSIGLNLSSGCIRMMNKDVEDLYSRVNIGTKVIVVGPGNKASNYITEAANPLAAIFGG